MGAATAAPQADCDRRDGRVGGAHLLTLVRLGVGGFNIADPDHFELVNFNRQAGASFDAIGRSKVEVMAERALQINPELRLRLFSRGVDPVNLDEFLSNTDLFIDALDFFALEIRREVNARCAERGIPVVNAAPLGMGAAFLVFKPGSMTFEDWFRLDGLSEEHRYVSYLLGISPSGLHRSYLVDPTRVDLRGHRGPSTAAACELCAGVAAVEAMKLLLGRGRVRAVPFYHHFDAYTGRWVVKKLRCGNGHPLQRIRIALARPLAARLSRQAAQRPTEADQ
jgi:molybdopterin/thiamine biosynthesis adenylyltransferase